MLLFDDFKRVDSSLKKHSEREYSFIDRSTWRSANRARDLCESWFGTLPESRRSHIANRFTGSDADHAGAYFELLLHEALCRLGFDFQYEQVVPGSRATPDFTVRSEQQRLHIEATSTIATGFEFDGDPNIRRLIDIINQIPNPYFWLDLSLRGRLLRSPAQHEVRKPITSFMDALKPLRSASSPDPESHWSMPTKRFMIDDLELSIGLDLKPRHLWGHTSDNSIGSGPSGIVSDIVPALVDKIRKKARKYRTSDKASSLLVALSVTEPFRRERDTQKLLVGRTSTVRGAYGDVAPRGVSRLEESVWFGKDGQPRRQNLAGVWVFYNAQPTYLMPAGDGNCLFLTPLQEVELPPQLLRFTHARWIDSKMVMTDGQDLNEFLGIPRIAWNDLHEPPN